MSEREVTFPRRAGAGKTNSELRFKAQKIAKIRFTDFCVILPPNFVKYGENSTVWGEFTIFHENGWDLPEIALLAPKSPFGRGWPPKHQRNAVFCNTLREGCPRGPLGRLFVNSIKCWGFCENHIKWWNSAGIQYFGVFL